MNGEERRGPGANRIIHETVPPKRMTLAESERQKDWDEEENIKKKETAGERVQKKLNERKKKKIRRIMIAAGAVCAFLYGMTAHYFSRHFYEGTEMLGVDCSQMTEDEVIAVIDGQLDQYRLEIEERGDRSEFVSAEQIHLAFAENGSVKQMLKEQNSFIWPIMLLRDRSSLTSVPFTYDGDAALEILSAMDCMQKENMIEPRDAYVKAVDTGFVVEPEVLGTTLDEQKTIQIFLSALNEGKTSISLDDADCYINPQRYSDDEALIREAEEKSALAKAYITYDFGDRQEVVNAPLIENWITTSAGGNYVIDDVKVTEYVETLAAKYDTFGLTREFRTSLGTTVTLEGGDYGWCMDQDGTVIDLLNALADGYQGNLEPEYLYTAMSRDTNDIGGTYVEICISSQEMWCYQDGECIVDTPVVTGNPNRGNATPSGSVWAVDAKRQQAVLVGEGYQAPVDYWIPFNGNIGIHDLKTRAYFGGTIYLTNGSHGCINTPYDAVQTIYNTVSIGTPVIVYE